jgi:ATP-dependent helicase/nuclease subunit A
MNKEIENISIINAGAGSGKTYRLTEKILDLINQGHDPSRVMAITFTKKAASELRSRISQKLIDEGNLKAAMAVSDGYIGTINSICGKILTEYAIDAGLSPSIDVIAEEDAYRLFKIAVDEVIARHADTIDPAAKLLSMEGDNDWRTIVRTIVDKVRSGNISVGRLEKMGKDSMLSFLQLIEDATTIDLDQKVFDSLDYGIEALENIETLKKTTANVLKELKDKQKIMRAGDRLSWADWVHLSKSKTAKDGEEAITDLLHWTGKVLQHPLFQKDMSTLITGIYSCASESLRIYDDYKHKQGYMDFIDQESKVLEICKTNSSVRKSLSERLGHLFVDEFQDTSPIQLSLFLELQTIIGASTWVGDPKQAIYGFRGADPVLMEHAAEVIGTSEILPYSWRSKKVLIDFVNALFSYSFHTIEKEKVVLSVPADRTAEASGGTIETWNLTASNNAEEVYALANGISDYLSRNTRYSPGDIAVLCRTNNECTTLSEALESIGINASAPKGNLLESRECQLVMAALRYLHDKFDTLALAEITHLHPYHYLYGKWLEPLMQKPEKSVAVLSDDDLIRSLESIRSHVKTWTPREAISEIIYCLDIKTIITAWNNPETRGRNLEAVSSAASDYASSCHSLRRPVTLTGFIRYMKESDLSQPQGIGANSVQILTYHKAKGLEWPVVVLSSLNKGIRDSFFGVRVKETDGFSLSDPLKDRNIICWPWPFGAQKKFDAIDSLIDNHPDYLPFRQRIIEEDTRLLYVGMTRAQNELVISARKKVTKSGESLETAWLDRLTDEDGNSLIDLPHEPGRQEIAVKEHLLSVDTFEYTPETTQQAVMEENDSWIDQVVHSQPEHPQKYIQPSRMSKDNATSEKQPELIADFENGIPVKQKCDPVILGNAVHSWFAVDDEVISSFGAEPIASKIIRSYGLEEYITASDLTKARANLVTFLQQKFPGAKFFREWPLSLRNELFQIAQGWVDMLVETEEGYIIIDHKTYSWPKYQQHALQYTAQLQAYAKAITAAQGKKVIGKYVYFPVLGKLVAV